ncbi:hypothetical protein [Pseudoduganella rhizocola]|uniref:hypothetical protein n=1 Tax=Pseudoduganella rhizocola TaxID=3382643 RepID=UPI0038B4E50D
MKLHHLFSALLLAACVAATPAHAADDASNFLLTPALMNKMKAIDAEVKKQKGGKEDDDEDAVNPETVADLAREFEKDKVAKAVLAKHGVSSREMASATFALMHAGMYVMFEQSMDKKKAAQLLAGYTKAQQANVALVRSMNAKK